jgi:hypothetical protein
MGQEIRAIHLFKGRIELAKIRHVYRNQAPLEVGSGSVSICTDSQLTRYLEVRIVERNGNRLVDSPHACKKEN